MRHDRYVISVKNDFKNSIKGITHDTSSSGETVYIEPLIIFEINNHLNELREDEKQEIERILRELSSMIADNYDVLHQDYLVISKMTLLLKMIYIQLSKEILFIHICKMYLIFVIMLYMKESIIHLIVLILLLVLIQV